MSERQHLSRILYTDICDHLLVSVLILVVIAQEKKNFMENEWLTQFF